MTTPPPTRRPNPTVAVRRVQSERKYLSPWSNPALNEYLQPHMVGVSQGILHGYYPKASHPFVVMTASGLAKPSSVAVIREEDLMAQDRLTSFLMGEVPPHRPRSLLSYPDSHVYESLISQMSDLASEEVCIETDAELANENSDNYELEQKIMNKTKTCERCTTCKKIKAPRSPGRLEDPDHAVPGPTPDAAATEEKSRSDLGPITKKEKSLKKTKTQCHSTESIFNKPEPKSYVKTYQKLLSLFRFRKKQVLPEVYEEITPAKKPSTSTQSTQPLIQQLPDLKDVQGLLHERINEQPSNNIAVAGSDCCTKLQNTEPILMKIWETNLLKSTSNHIPSNVERVEIQKVRKFKKSFEKTDKSTQVSMEDIDTIKAYQHFSTLDPLRPPPKETSLFKAKLSQASKSMLDLRKKVTTHEPPQLKTASTSTQHDNPAAVADDTIPPLVVDFGSESSEDDKETHNMSWSLNSADQESCLYSSGDFWSLAHKNSDSFVFVYKVDDQASKNNNLLTSTKLPNLQMMTRGGSSGLGSSGSDFSSDDSSKNTTAAEMDPSNVSFTEPNYNASGMKVGSRGHLQFDYSWSWSHLNNYVRLPNDDQKYSRVLPRLPPFLKSALPLEAYTSPLIV